MKKPFLSVQILNYNGKKFIKNCIDSLLKQDYPNFEIIFIDNNSSDKSIEYLKNNYSKQIKTNKIKILKFKKNYGFAEGYNKSYSKTKADYVLLLNNDVKLVNKHFLSSLIITSKKENASIVGGLDFPFETKKFNKHKKYGSLNILGMCTPNLIITDNNPSFIGGACLLVDKSKVNHLFLDEYFMYSEDVYLSFKELCKGSKIILDRNAIFLHFGSGTSKSGSVFIRYHAEKNRLINLLIFFKISSLLKLLPLFFLENIIKTIYLIKHPKKLNATFKGIFWPLFHIKFIFRERNKIQKSKIIGDDELFSSMSYKIFPEHLSRFSKKLNLLSKIYCRIFKINTYD
jgi:GT2 family glycosyltransferase